MLSTLISHRRLQIKEREITMLKIVESTTVDELREEISNDEVDTNYVSINDATKLLNFKYAQYTRRLVLEGKLNAIKVQYAHYAKWMILRKSIENYTTNKRRNVNGARRFILRTAIENQSKVQEALEKLDIVFELELSYIKKSK